MQLEQSMCCGLRAGNSLTVLSERGMSKIGEAGRSRDMNGLVSQAKELGFHPVNDQEGSMLQCEFQKEPPGALREA